MPNQPSRPAGRPRKTKTVNPAQPIALVVRRGALRRFDTLKAKTKGLPVTVTWDRRTTERRACDCDIAGDRRRTDRRQRPPYTWEVADFVVTEHAPEAGPRKKVPAKKSS